MKHNGPNTQPRNGIQMNTLPAMRKIAHNRIDAATLLLVQFGQFMNITSHGNQTFIGYRLSIICLTLMESDNIFQ